MAAYNGCFPGAWYIHKRLRELPDNCWFVRHYYQYHTIILSALRALANALIMAIMEPNYEQEMMRLWSIIADLSEHLNQHRACAASLHAQAGGVKVRYYSHRPVLCLSIVLICVVIVCAQSQAIHSQTGFVLRRFVILYTVCTLCDFRLTGLF